MGEFSEAALEVSEAFDTDLAEQVVNFTYRTVDLTDYTSRGVPGMVEQYEVDGESVFAESTRWIVLKHELSVEPTVDDTIVIGAEKHRVGRVLPVDEVVAWYIYTSR